MVDFLKEIVYGPLESDRMGNYLGINLLPTRYKLCPYNCIYCRNTSPSLYPIDLHEHEDEIPTVATVIDQLEQALKEPNDIDYLFFAGQGEPTVHPEFPAILAETARVRDELAPSLDICVLSNGAWLNRAPVTEAYKFVDVPILKLDVGSAALWKKIYRPMSSIKFSEVIAGAKSLDRLYLQSVFFDGPTNNIQEDNLKAWIDLVGRLKPISVQLYTLQDLPRKSPYQPISLEKLNEIGQMLQEQSGVPFCVYRIMEELNSTV